MGYITYTSEDKLDIAQLMNQWVQNGWDLNKKFIRVCGGGSSSWITIFYEKDLDYKCLNELTTI